MMLPEKAGQVIGLRASDDEGAGEADPAERFGFHKPREGHVVELGTSRVDVAEELTTLGL